MDRLAYLESKWQEYIWAFLKFDMTEDFEHAEELLRLRKRSK